MKATIVRGQGFIIEWDAYQDQLKRFNNDIRDQDINLSAIPHRDAILPWIVNHICTYVLNMPAGSNTTVTDGVFLFKHF